MMPNYTQHRFAEALIELMKTVPADKITVKQISDHCNERRQTFYYYFKDKYDLMTWIYYQDAMNTIEEHPDETWDVVLEHIFEKMKQKRSFYKNAFSESGQNALIYSILDHDILLYSNVLSVNNIDRLWNDELSFAVQYHAHACVYITKRWIEEDTPISPASIARHLYSNMPEELKKALENRRKPA